VEISTEGQSDGLNCQLHDDDVAATQELPDLPVRTRLPGAFCEGYKLDLSQRHALVDQMIEIAVGTAAQEAVDSGVSPAELQPAPIGRIGGGEPMNGHELLWAVTWRTRSARWLLEHRAALDRVVA
jgi:hypothetical protein